MIIYIIRCHRYNDEIIKKTDLSNITTGEILHYIDDNYGNNLTLPGLAKKFGLSESGLSKKIKAFTNMTFKEYLTKTRIEAAKSLLISSEKTSQKSLCCVVTTAATFSVMSLRKIWECRQAVIKNAYNELDIAICSGVIGSS